MDDLLSNKKRLIYKLSKFWGSVQNNKSVLIWSDICKLKKIKDDYIVFNLEFLDINLLKIRVI